MSDKLIKEHSFKLSPFDSDGESLYLYTEIYDNGEYNGVNSRYLNQKLTLNSYGNSATFNLVSSPLTPDVLRKLADELEKAISFQTPEERIKQRLKMNPNIG